MIQVFTLENTAEWDRIVRSFSDYDVYYLNGYVKAFQLHGDGEPLLIYYEGAGLRGINVVMRRDIARDKHFVGKLPEGIYYDLSTPYGYGGWLLNGDGDKRELFAAYEAWCRKKRIVSEFVRFHPVINNSCFSEGTYDVVPLGETVALDLSSPEIIWANFSSQNRNKIRKAEKNGVRVYHGRSENLYKQFAEIYNGTMERDHATDYYYFKPEFYMSLCYDLPENAQVFYAVNQEGQMIAASIMLAANGRLNYHLSGSIYEYRNLAPSNLLLYKAALWGSANGCKTFHLGGGVGSENDDLLEFKRSFYRGELRRFYIGKKIFDQTTYEKLLSIRKEEDSMIEETTYFPKYRGGTL